MRKNETLFKTVFALIAYQLFSIITISAEDKYALLIGVTKYNHARMNQSKLKYPEEDAKAIAKVLQQSGYKVELLLGKNATQSAIKKALKKAGSQGSENGAMMIGLFGHGVQYGKSAYYCPQDANVKVVKDSNDKPLRDKSGRLMLEPDPESLVSMREVLDTLTLCNASNRILLADCCREDPNAARGGTAFGTELTTNDLPPGTVAMFACSKNEQAFEHDDWKHGAFTYAFLKHVSQLSAGGKVTDGTLKDLMFDTVKKMVKEKTSGRSSQSIYTLSSGQVEFKLKEGVKVAGFESEKMIRPVTDGNAANLAGSQKIELAIEKAGDENAKKALESILNCLKSGRSSLYLTDQKLKSVPPEIGLLTQLETLDISENELQDLPDEIWNLKKLKFLRINKNNLTVLPPDIGELTNLIEFEIRSNKLKKVPGELGRLSKLEKLSLSYNDITYLPTDLGKLQKLKALYIMKNDLGTVPSCIWELKALEKLSLYANGISVLPSQIENLSKLTWLDLGINKLKQLPPEIGSLKNLETLWLPSNGIKSLPAEITQLTKLADLDLRFTGVDEFDLQILKPLKKLRKLSLLSTPVSESGLANLKRMLPNCVIETRFK